jgi:hypothetical protein
MNRAIRLLFKLLIPYSFMCSSRACCKHIGASSIHVGTASPSFPLGNNCSIRYLDAIYDRIKCSPISLKEDDDLRDKAGSTDKGSGQLGDMFRSERTIAGRRKLEAYTKERAEMMRESELAFTQVTRRRDRSHEEGVPPRSQEEGQVTRGGSPI